jgi:hypothetical protein
MFPFRFHIHEIISFNSSFLQQNSIHRSIFRFQRITINNYSQCFLGLLYI